MYVVCVLAGSLGYFPSWGQTKTNPSALGFCSNDKTNIPSIPSYFIPFIQFNPIQLPPAKGGAI